MNEDRICLWADGTWCYFNELEEYTWMSDDYEVVDWSDRELDFDEWQESCFGAQVYTRERSLPHAA